MANKLELTWYGKEDKIKVEPRLLIEKPELSNCANDPDTENMIIHGDNLLALKALEKKFAGKVKCIYIDPPYNTGAAFEHYDDNLEHSIWLGLMRERLKLLRNLLDIEQGCIFVQIDDEEHAYLKVLMDEVFERRNYISTVSVLMKNIAGASGGGEDKRLKKNIEYILIYARNYDTIRPFTPVYALTPLGSLVEEYKRNNKSWKYTSILVDKGEKEYITSTVDGDGNEIRIYKRCGFKSMSVAQYARQLGITEAEAYDRYFDRIYRTTMPQSSIRPRVMEKMKEINREEDVISIEYIPKSGRNRGLLYEQFYSGNKYNLFAWLSDVTEVKDGQAYKKDLQGTYWDFVGETKNLTKEGNVAFPNGKKAERLIQRVIAMSTSENDLVLDSFLGSGTTCAVAQKMNRRYIGVEMGDHAYTHCKVRQDKVIAGEDSGGITKEVGWLGGGAYKFYELAPTLINKDSFGESVINKEYSADMLAAAVALHEGYSYCPDQNVFWKQSKGNEKSFLFVTTQRITESYLEAIKETMDDGDFLIIACKAFETGLEKRYSNVRIKKIPQMLLSRCEFGKENYDLNIVNPPVYEDEEEERDDE